MVKQEKPQPMDMKMNREKILPDHCSHGVAWEKQCVACERLWYAGVSTWASANAHHHRRRLDEIEERGARTAKTPKGARA